MKNKIKRKRKNAPGQGRKPEGREIHSIGMLPEFWKTIDGQRGNLSRGRQIEKLIGGAVLAERDKASAASKRRPIL